MPDGICETLMKVEGARWRRECGVRMGLRESDEFAAFVAECQKLGLADVKAPAWGKRIVSAER